MKMERQKVKQDIARTLLCIAECRTSEYLINCGGDWQVYTKIILL